MASIIVTPHSDTSSQQWPRVDKHVLVLIPPLNDGTVFAMNEVALDDAARIFADVEDLVSVSDG